MSFCVEIMIMKLSKFLSDTIPLAIFCIFRSPTNCDHGYLSGLGAQKLDTIFRHYYPESGFGWIILVVGILIAIITHGFQLSAVLFLIPVQKKFKVSEVECLGE